MYLFFKTSLTKIKVSGIERIPKTAEGSLKDNSFKPKIRAGTALR